ncbi:MAG: gliding motility-associated C-terminal domain-containing protein [Bacteroidales bacterium]
MKRILSIIFGIVFLLMIAEAGYAQCSNCVSNFPSGTFSSTNASLETVSTCMYGGEYAYFDVTSGETYTWTTCSDSDFDTQLSLYQGTSCGGTDLAYNDDDCGLQSTITWTATFTGTVTVLLSEYPCSSNSTCMTLEWACTSCGGGTPSGDCDDALPFCTSDSYTFPASTDVSGMGSVGCLGSTPNPAWYWMEINDPGDIDIYISSGADVDFIAWGPFNSLSEGCATDLMSTTGVDCSYSTAATETCNLTGTQAGEVYILLITNYANVETNISFSQTAGSGTTNCGIIAPPIENNGPLCEGETLELTVTTPEPGASYSWSGPNGFTSTAMEPTVPNVSTADAGTYSLEITIGPDTSDPETTDVEVNPNVTPTFNAVGPYCEGDVIPALPTTSNEGITGSWSPAIDNMNTTSYTFTPDAGQCALTTSMTIDITPQTSPTFDQAGPYCYGSAIPDLPTTSDEGIAGSWSPAIDNTSTTTYTFTPDAGECASTTSMTIDITPQTIPAFDAPGPYCEDSPVPALPTTSNNGITGSWSPAIDNSTTTTYTFTPDPGECATSVDLTIDIIPKATPTFDPVGPYCAGENIPDLPDVSDNGISGSWTPAINNTSTTNYTFTPASGECALASDMTITVFDNPVPAADNTSPLCEGESLEVSAEPDGMLSYTWTGPNGFASSEQNPVVSDTAGVSASGTYTVLVENNNGCTAEAETIVEVYPQPEISLTYEDPLCFESCDGEIEVMVSSGSMPYEYSIDGGMSFSMENVFDGLCEGSYNPVVRDAQSCTAEYETVDLTDPLPLSVDLVSVQDQNCQSPGSAEVSAYGGTAPHDYHWPADAGGVDNGLAAAIPAGDYVVSVTDAHNCQEELQLTVGMANDFSADAAVKSHVQCFGEYSGVIEVDISSGTPNYEIDWTGGSEITAETAYTIRNLPKGTYGLTVSDADGCSETFDLTVDGPDAPLSVQIQKQDVSCHGAADGKAQAFVSGGTTPYTFEWRKNYLVSQNAFAGHLSGGNYHLSLIDDHNCVVDTSISIYEPSEILVDFILNHPSCRGNNNGYIELTVSGGTEPYTYFRGESPGNFPYFDNLYEGDYDIKIVDADGCKKKLKTITLADDPVECLRIPNAFTPNGDDNNDTWIIENLEMFPKALVKVYNRWGQVVYSGMPGDEPWDGKDINGKRVNTGSYLYHIEIYTDTKPYTGVVTVVY